MGKKKSVKYQYLQKITTQVVPEILISTKDNYPSSPWNVNIYKR